MERIKVIYSVKSIFRPEETAKKLAEEQGHGGEGRIEYATQVEEVRQINGNLQITLGFPVVNFENDLPAFYQFAVGEIHNIKGIKVRIDAVLFPSDYLLKFNGPKYGIDGIREKLQVYDRPLLCGPVKPCMGLTPGEFAQKAYEAWIGGLDIVKHDELTIRPDTDLLENIVARTTDSLDKAIEKTGEQKLYVVNMGGSSKLMPKYLEIIEKYSVSGVLVSPAINGLDIAETLPKIVFAHNSSDYALREAIDFSVLVELQRISGIDVKIMPAPYGSFEIMTPEEHKRNVAACLKSMGNIKGIFPAFTGKQGADTIKKHFDDVGKDFILVSGAKVFEHPKGICAGAKELRDITDKLK